MSQRQQPVQIDGKQLFWDMAFQAYRVKAWYDVGQAAANFGKVTIKSLPDLLTLCIVVPLWVATISILLPYRVAQVLVRYGRWMYYIPHRRRVREEGFAQTRRNWQEYVSPELRETVEEKQFSLDAFVSRF
jgi:hypothetical protein